MKVGEELLRETLPLQGGSRLYQIQDLKPHTWYEVKISYPASVCTMYIMSFFQFFAGELSFGN